MYFASGATARDRIGEGTHPAQNPPPLEGGNRRAWAWFHENVGPFAERYGVVAQAFGDLGLRGAQRVLFLWKMNEILMTLLREEADKAAKEQKHG